MSNDGPPVYDTVPDVLPQEECVFDPIPESALQNYWEQLREEQEIRSMRTAYFDHLGKRALSRLRRLGLLEE